MFDIFNEISILDIYRFVPDITEMHDFGMNKNDFYLIMKKYKTSLKEWRLK